MKSVKNIVRNVVIATSTLLFVVSANVFSGGSENNVNKNDVAISGYDPVAYHMDQRAKKGKGKYSAVYNDAIYHFSSESNRDTFKINPKKYAPAFGGYCAMGVALVKKLDVDPEAWKIVDGTLYLNLNKDVQKKWSEDISGNLVTANKNWKDIQYTSAEKLNAN